MKLLTHNLLSSHVPGLRPGGGFPLRIEVRGAGGTPGHRELGGNRGFRPPARPRHLSPLPVTGAVTGTLAVPPLPGASFSPFPWHRRCSVFTRHYSRYLPGNSSINPVHPR